MKDFPVRAAVLAALLLAILAVAWLFVLRPNDARNKAMQEEIKIKQAKLYELNKATGMIGDLEAEIHAHNEAIGYFQSKLPSEKEMEKVLKDIWLLARQNNLSPKVVKADRSDKAGFFEASAFCSEQPIELELEGDFFGFYSFMQALENQDRITRIAQMDLRHDDKCPVGHLKAKLGMSIFFERTADQPEAPKAKGT